MHLIAELDLLEKIKAFLADRGGNTPIATEWVQFKAFSRSTGGFRERTVQSCSTLTKAGRRKPLIALFNSG